MKLFSPLLFLATALLVPLCVLSQSPPQSQDAAQQEVGDLYASDATVRGSVLLAAGGMKVLSGSSVVAGEYTALLRLRRGGEVRFCPGTAVSIASTQPGRNLMVGMSTGQIEVNYRLEDSFNSADALVTPDFRILLEGPGDFRFAFGADNKGNTCVRSLPGNTGSAVVTELMGDASYQVRPQEEILFRAGKLAQRQRALPSDCGCPEPPPVLRAGNVQPETPLPGAVPGGYPVTAQIAEPANAPRTPAPPPEIHLQVDVPFVFSAGPAEPADVGQAQVEIVSLLPIRPTPRFRMEVVAPPEIPAEPVAVAQQAPAEVPRPRKRSLLGRVGSFFSSIFR
ncbi:MAG: hypothetical protein AB7O65_09920 [Candidatus Korobacteraceae bacterium]